MPTEDEFAAAYAERRAPKIERRQLRQQAAQGDADAIARLAEMSANAGQGVAVGKGTKEERKKGVMGKKGQKLIDGVLPGGKHATGKIQERARGNKEKAMKREEKAEENLVEAKALEIELER